MGVSINEDIQSGWFLIKNNHHQSVCTNVVKAEDEDDDADEGSISSASHGAELDGSLLILATALGLNRDATRKTDMENFAEKEKPVNPIECQIKI